jgi:hypothetical protein
MCVLNILAGVLVFRLDVARVPAVWVSFAVWCGSGLSYINVTYLLSKLADCCLPCSGELTALLSSRTILSRTDSSYV